MKQLYLFSIAILFAFGSFAQDGSGKKGNPAEPVKSISVKGGSATKAKFILKLSDADFRAKLESSEEFRKEHLVKRVNGVNYVNLYYICNGNGNSDLYGVLPTSFKNNIHIGLIPIDQLLTFSNDPDVSYVQIADRVYSKLDDALWEMSVLAVHQGLSGLSQDCTGDGVVVGILDGGFDYGHLSFFDTSFTNYRVARVWDQNSTAGSPPTGYSYGTEFASESAILNEGYDEADESHGTHVAGIAGGSGCGNGNYTGVAYESELVFVANGSGSTDLNDGIDYIIAHANSVNKPCVMNMSLGTQIGPHDGFSPFDQFCDATVGEGKILVGAASNEGDYDLHIGKTFSSTDTLLYSLVTFVGSQLGNDGSGTIDIWGAANQSFKVAMNVYDDQSGQWLDYTPYISSSASFSNSYNLTDNNGDICAVTISTGSNSTTGKQNIHIEVDNSAQDES